jgi:DNA (cytosine-5)-methyltransferase 1
MTADRVDGANASGAYRKVEQPSTGGDALGGGTRPRLLDLFCCEGGASRGYDLAGFDVYGIDLFTKTKGGFSRKRYPYPARQGDALFAMEMLLADGGLRFDNGELLVLRDFAAVHASPPCQHASAGTRAMRSKGDTRHPALIEPTRDLLRQTGLPYVIENVKGAALVDPVVYCGTEFGLRTIDDDGTPLEMWRHRLFEANWPLYGRTGCQHGLYATQVAGSYGGARRDKDEARNVRHGGYVPSKRVQQELLGIDWMTERGMYQALPPAYTQEVGRRLLAHLRQEVAA